MTAFIQAVLTPLIQMLQHMKQRISFHEWKETPKKCMSLTKRDSIGVNKPPEFCRESHMPLSRDIKEQAKVSSTDLEINGIRIWKASNIIDKYIPKIGKNYMKCVQNLRAGVNVIEPLKPNQEVLAIKRRSEKMKLEYQIVKDLIEYSQYELDYYKEHQFTILKIILSKIT